MYRPSPITSGAFEIPLHLTFTCDQKETLAMMNVSMYSLYNWDYTGLVDDKEDESSDADDESFFINTKDDRCHDLIVLD